MREDRSTFARIMEDKGVIYQCECQNEIVSVQKMDDEDTVEIAIWHNYSTYPLGLLSRLRYCWHILRSGRPYGDQVVLNKSKARALSERLFEFSCEKDFETKS